MLLRAFYITLVAVFMLPFLSSAWASDNGVNEKTIIFGQTAALDGPAQALGQGMNEGISAAFKEFNNKGGINGRMLELVAYDDGYEPDQAIENTKKMIEKDNVFALIGGVGTPTAKAIEPITSENKVPFIGPFTGAEFLRSPFKRYVVNIRGSYWQETEEWVERLTTDLGIERIAILYQDDSYGRAGRDGVKKALEKRNMRLVGEGTYKRNTTAVKSAVLQIRKANPQAVVMVGAYRPCAEFIKVSKKIGFNPLFVNISFVGSKALAKELGPDGEGVIISQVVPFPFDVSQSKLVEEYHEAMEVYKPDYEPGFVSMEGYLVGHFAAQILQELGPDVTREAFLDKIYELKEVKIHDASLYFGDKDNQGMDQVFMTRIAKDELFVPIETLKQ